MNATVKRKFNALVQGIGNSSSASSSSPTTTTSAATAEYYNHDNNNINNNNFNESSSSIPSATTITAAAAATMSSSSPSPLSIRSSLRTINSPNNNSSISSNNILRSSSTGDDLLSTKKRRVGGTPTPPTRFSSTTTTTPQRGNFAAEAAVSSPAEFGGVGGVGGGSIRFSGTIGPSGVRHAAAAAASPTTSVSNITLRKYTPLLSSSSSKSGGIGQSGSTSSLVESDGRLPPPKYCPADREQLLRRLATYQELTDWTPKPDPVNEVEWAKRGWVCTGKERVKCSLCGAELVVKINKREVDGREVSILIASEIEDEVVRRYRDLVVDGHGQECLWRRKGCDDSLIRLPLPNPRLALQTLRERYDELCSRSAVFLPYEFNLRLPESLDLDEVISYLPATFFSNPAPAPTSTSTSTSTSTPTPAHQNDANANKVNRTALALALTGWQGLTNPRLGNAPIPNSASCHTCLRRLGLWMFKSKEIDPETNRVIVPAPMDHLDPVAEHRFFCPWKNGAVQRNPGLKDGGKEEAKAAWEVLKEVLRNESFIRSKVEGGSHGSVGGGGGGGGIGHWRSKSAAAPSGSGQVAQTPERRRPITSGSGVGTPGSVAESEGGGAEGEGQGQQEEETRKKKDQDMMSRLRRVRSLFNTKKNGSGGSASRPGTSHSNRGAE